MAVESLEGRPFQLALGSLLVRGAPPIEVFAKALVVVGYRPKSLIAGEANECVKVVSVRRPWKWRGATGAPGEVLEALKERGDLRIFLTCLVGDGSGREGGVPDLV